MILLRFRDISIPDGETIIRHKSISSKLGFVWWGWITRAEEAFPTHDLVEISRRLEESSEPIMMVHTDFNVFYQAEVLTVHAHLDGKKMHTPQEDYTPKYMHENQCTAWFKLSRIASCKQSQIKKVAAAPTILSPNGFDETLLKETPIPVKFFKSSGATLWIIDP